MNQDIKEKMQAVAIDQYGDTGEMNVKEVPMPDLKPDQILVRIEYAGVGRWDAAEREGVFAQMSGKQPEFPEVLGAEGEGKVVGIGENVTKFSEGDQVYCVAMQREPTNGFYAQFTAVNQNEAWKVPDNLQKGQAGALPIDGGTALRGLRDVLKMKEGETLMIFGASGGVGHLALQLVKRMGVKVFAIASGEDGVELVKRLGADAVADGHSSDLLLEADTFAPDGIDAALVTAGGDTVEEALKAVREGGRVAYPMGVQPEPKAPDGVQVESYNGDFDNELMEHLNELIEAGPFEVHIARAFPLNEVAKAHDTLAGHYLGRLVLDVDSGGSFMV